MNRQITVSSGGCVQARCGTLGILAVLLTLDDALLHLLGIAAIFALPQMDLAFHRYIPSSLTFPMSCGATRGEPETFFIISVSAS